MSLSRNLSQSAVSRRTAKGSPGRTRGRQMKGMVEVLEGRCLLAVTSTTPVPISVIETTAFNGAVMNFTASDAGGFTATIVWGDLSSSAGVVTPSSGGFVVSGTHTYAEDGFYTATVAITDAADNTTVAPTTTATVTESSLSASSANFTVPENAAATTVTTATFSDPGSSDPASDFTASIDWGDGTTTAGVVTGGAGNYAVTGTHAYLDEGSFTVTTTAFETNPPSFPISVNSTATVTEADTFTNGAITAPVAPIEGAAFSGASATFSDPGYPTNTPDDFSATINWGDGSAPTAGTIFAGPGVGNFTINGNHSYLEEGSYPVTVVVADNAPGTATLTINGTVNVADAALTATPVVINGTERAPLTNVDVATFVDADPLGTVTDFLATINWGDGTPVTAGVVLQDAAGTFHVQGSHTYTEENSAVYPVTVSIVDNGNGRTVTDPTDSRATANSTANIAQSPLLPVANSVVATEGSAIAVGTPLATFTDRGGADAVGDYTATVNWGDGSGPVAATVTLLGNGGNFQVSAAAAHTYAEEGIYAVTVMITDADPTNPGAIPTIASTTSTANVADAPLTASATQPNVPAQTEGVAFTGAVSSFTDANPTATPSEFVATIDWGDGSPQSAGTISQPGGIGTAFLVDGTHTFKQEGSFTVRVVTTDDGGMRVSSSASVVVGDPALSGATAVPVRAVEGTNTGLITLATFVDPDPNSTPHDWSVAITWGDGSPVGIGRIELISGDPVTGGNIFAVVGSHTYRDESPLSGTASVVITDVDNRTANPTTLPLVVTVVDAPLSSQGGSVQAIEGIAFNGQLLATLTDANPFATVADFNTGAGSISVNWGDGTSSSLTSSPAVTVTAGGTPNGVVFSIFGSHTYTEEGSYKVTVTATDVGGSTTIAHSEADVADAKLTAPTQTAINTTESPIFPVPVFGAPIFTGAVGSFNDLNPGGDVEDFLATIDWGDGTAQSAGTVSQSGGLGSAFMVAGSHTYGDAGVNGGMGQFPITVYITDVGGSKLTIHNTAKVADAPIVLTGVLDTASDSGMSNTDAITNVNHPVFHGTSEPFSHVTLFATPTGGGAARQIGQTTAKADGSWKITSVLLLDGNYTISGSATDQFGKTTAGNSTPGARTTFLPNSSQGPLVIDTVGPKVFNVYFNRLNGQINVIFGDDRSGLNQATLVDAANYQLTKPHTRPGAYLVTQLVASGQASPTDLESVAVVFNGTKVLRGGFYTLTIRDSSAGASSIQDVAGNHLDGEFYGNFASGNGIPGGDFVAQLDAMHNKVFAPQTVIGTANAGNGGNGGPAVGAVHSGNFNRIVPRGAGGGGFIPIQVQRQFAIQQAAIHRAALVHQTSVAHPKGPKIRKK